MSSRARSTSASGGRSVPRLAPTSAHAHRRVEVRQIPCRDEVQCRAHQERLDDRAPERPLQCRSLEAFDPSPERQVGRRGELRLQSSEPLDRSRQGESRSRRRSSWRSSVVRLSSRCVRDPLGHASTLVVMSVRVRMAPSPTGLLHIGNVRTGRSSTGCSLGSRAASSPLRIENTDTSREVAEATDQIQGVAFAGWASTWTARSTFQLDRMDDCRRVAEELVAADKAYEDEGAIRFRMPDEGDDRWDDVVRGRIEVPNETIEDLVLVRTDGRPTYNFASPMEDVWDGITHVIRGEDHISNTPKQINIIRAVGAEVPGLRARPERERHRQQEALEASRRGERQGVSRRRVCRPER